MSTLNVPVVMMADVAPAAGRMSGPFCPMANTRKLLTPTTRATVPGPSENPSATGICPGMPGAGELHHGTGREFKDGECAFRKAETHAIQNTDTKEIHVLNIELKK